MEKMVIIMIKKLTSLALILSLVMSLFAVPIFASIDKTLDIDIGEDYEGKIKKFEDGRISPVSFAEELTESQLENILVEMGFSKDEISDMGITLKTRLVSDGGKRVKTTPVHATYRTGDGKNEVTFEGESIDEIKEQLKADKESGQFKAAWDKEEENWHGKTYVTWAGLTGNGKEFKYNFYIEFEWDSNPFQQMTDHFALHWGDKGTKYASGDWTVVQALKPDNRYGGGSWTDIPVTNEQNNLAGTEWSFRWYDVQTAYKVRGTGHEEIRIPVSKAGETYTYAGAYFHPWWRHDVAIVLGPVGITFSDDAGDKWTWDESFEIGDDRPNN
ncbi:hypothetical protein P4V60_17710 [Brevibacillus porteri]|uniref:Uncharacterized protein n=2 Tax=Brevibacillus TaxID=55080 RepID=A0ABX5FPK5_9BACL|nr:hypothetical protein [Brevibacillus porteri]MED1800417.1 hypothetical protein [Brevibacillus porteri]MED2134002.1 hypothetical protein [Brevibacillus porteri]PSK09880.1 hypothetical protein C7R92_14120 [Brevibacillus porteri]